MSDYLEETQVYPGEILKGDLHENQQKNVIQPGVWNSTYIYSWRGGVLSFHVPALVGPDQAYLDRLRLYGDGKHISDYGVAEVEVWPGGFAIVDVSHLLLAPFGNRVPAFTAEVELEIPVGAEGTVEEAAGW